MVRAPAVALTLRTCDAQPADGGPLFLRTPVTSIHLGPLELHSVVTMPEGHALALLGKPGERVLAIDWLLLREKDSAFDFDDLSLARGLIDGVDLAVFAGVDLDGSSMTRAEPSIDLLLHCFDGHMRDIACTRSYNLVSGRWRFRTESAREWAELDALRFAEVRGKRVEKLCDQTAMDEQVNLVTLKTAMPCARVPKDARVDRRRDRESGLCEAGEYKIDRVKIVLGVNCKDYTPSWWSSKTRKIRPILEGEPKPQLAISISLVTGSIFGRRIPERPAEILNVWDLDSDLAVETSHGSAKWTGREFVAIEHDEYMHTVEAVKRHEHASCREASALRFGTVGLSWCDGVLEVKDARGWSSAETLLAGSGYEVERFALTEEKEPWLVVKGKGTTTLFAPMQISSTINLREGGDLSTLALQLAEPLPPKDASCNNLFLDLRAADDAPLGAEAKFDAPIHFVRYRGERRAGYLCMANENAGSSLESSSKELAPQCWEVADAFPKARTHCHYALDDDRDVH